MEQTSAATLLSTEDVVLGILFRVSADAVALFRCAVACKRWRVLVADRSFLRRCWLENTPGPSTLLGFFVRQCIDATISGACRLYFVPLPAVGSVIGAQRRLVTSMFEGGLPDDDLHRAEPHAVRRGLLLLRLFTGIRYNELVQMAVCDPVAGTCHILPPLECRVTFVSCSVLMGAECRQNQQSLDQFKVLVIVFFRNPNNEDDVECNLYTFSSTECRWSTPRKCFDEIYRRQKSGFVLHIHNPNNIVCGTVVHWLAQYYSAHAEEPPKYYTLDVSADTGHTSLTEVSIPANRFGMKFFQRGLTLGVTSDGSLSLFFIDNKAPIWQLHMWKRGNDIDSKVWLHSRVNLSRQLNPLWDLRIWPVEKSDTLIIIDNSQYLRKINVETGEVEEHRLQKKLNSLAMPMNIEWPTLFASRLG